MVLTELTLSLIAFIRSIYKDKNRDSKWNAIWMRFLNNSFHCKNYVYSGVEFAHLLTLSCKCLVRYRHTLTPVSYWSFLCCLYKAFRFFFWTLDLFVAQIKQTTRAPIATEASGHTKGKYYDNWRTPIMVPLALVSDFISSSLIEKQISYEQKKK